VTRGNLFEWNPALERLIGAVRLALAAGSLAVIWIDPTQPSKHVGIAYTAFTLYLVYSAIAFQMIRVRPRPWLPVTTQLIDLLWIPPVLLFTEAGNTPYFPFFVVIMLTAGMRWGVWASWAVTAYSLIVYAILLFIEPPTPLDLNNDIMQLGYFLIVGILGGYLAEYRRKREAELKILRAASELIGTRYTAAGALEAVVDTMRSSGVADAVMAVIRTPVEGEVLAIRGAGDVTCLGAEEAALFFSAAANGRGGKGSSGAELSETDSLLLRFAEAERGLAYPVRAGDEVVGWVFLFFHSVRTVRRISADFPNLLLTHVIPQLETLYVLEQAPHARVAEERRRIARDLHDSFIQALAAFGLRLDVICGTGGAIPAPISRDLAQLREMVAQEYQRVRAYVTDMRDPTEIGPDLRALIDHVVAPFRTRTRLPVDVAIGAEVAPLPRAVARELAPLLREALTNVEKHARATRVAVVARLDKDELVVTIQDDGVGVTAPHVGIGPSRGHGLSSMRERATLLGGDLTVNSGVGGGTELIVSIPARRFA